MTADDGWSFCTKAEADVARFGRASRSERPYVTDMTRAASTTKRLMAVSYRLVRLAGKSSGLGRHQDLQVRALVRLVSRR